MKRTTLAAVCAFAVLPAAAGAQSLSLAPKIGTSGIGADIGVGLNRHVVLRGGVGIIPVELEQEEDGIDWNLQFPNNATVGLDFHPTGGSFRISAGAFFQTKELELEGIVPDQVEIGNTTYSKNEISSLNGVLESKAAAPFVTLGFGHHGSSGIGLLFEVGGAYLGDPDVTLSATGNATSYPEFDAELAREEANLEDDIGPYAKWYPILNLGLRIGL